MDIEKQCLRYAGGAPAQESADEHLGAESQALLRLRQCNFVLPELAHLRLRQMAASLDMPIYPVARTVVFLGIYYFDRDIQNPKMQQYLLEFLRDHHSLQRDRIEALIEGS